VRNFIYAGFTFNFFLPLRREFRSHFRDSTICNLKINLAIPSIAVFPLEFLPSYHCLSNWYRPHRVCVPSSLIFSQLLSLTAVGVHAAARYHVICKFNLLHTRFLLSNSSDFLCACNAEPGYRSSIRAFICGFLLSIFPVCYDCFIHFGGSRIPDADFLLVSLACGFWEVAIRLPHSQRPQNLRGSEPPLPKVYSFHGFQRLS
jgi:hypothetical protein